MNNLFVLFDPACAFCRRCKIWLQSQKQIVTLTFIEANSKDAKCIFPALNHEKTLAELTVVSDRGGVYQGTKAWLICLWALRDYRNWASTLGTPELLPVAQKFITMISSNRKTLSRIC
ncbi:MAG: DUF393 domain-containing protein [Candidatus Obscuribacterales bacterium]|nr:DUF393 domain-containing protein [Candidatus Obscuribacterales bacterium]